VARDFDLTETGVRAWVRRAEVDASERDGLSTEEPWSWDWPTQESRRRALFDYIEGWYNVRRLYSCLLYTSAEESRGHGAIFG